MLGVSRDTVASHQKFKANHQIPFSLLSDPNGEVCAAYDVLKEKNRFGKKVIGIQRSTFIIDGKGNIEKAYRGVKVDGHIRELINSINV